MADVCSASHAHLQPRVARFRHLAETEPTFRRLLDFFDRIRTFLGLEGDEIMSHVVVRIYGEGAGLTMHSGICIT